MSVASNHDSYIFQRDIHSSIRLNYQHGILKQLTGYLIHPDISLAVPGSRIADIGTGTAIWLIEASALLPPETRFDGFDVSAAQYPTGAWLPSNVYLHTHDVFSPFALEHHGQYDVVHMRFMISLITNKNIYPLLENLASLLKPSGSLQWTDVDVYATNAIAVSPDVKKSATQELVSMMRSPHPNMSSPLNVQSLIEERMRLSECALSVKSLSQIPIQNSYREFWDQTQLLACEEYFAKMTAEKNALAAAKARHIIDNLSGTDGEFRKGASVDVSFFCLVAEKTSNGSSQ